MKRMSRREVLRGGLGAFIAGLAGPRAWAAPFGWPAGLGCVPSGGRPIKTTGPVRLLEDSPPVRMLAGLPYHMWWTGDDWADDQIPFHPLNLSDPQKPSEDVSIAIVGGGLSGLSTAYLLRQHHPVVLEFRDRFGGNAQGEEWSKSRYSLGTAYFIAPDKGDFLETLYLELGLDRAMRFAGPGDPVELNGVIRDDFWTGKGLPPEELPAFKRYAEVVQYMAKERYPDIPLPKGKDNQWIRDLDQRTFLQDVEMQMGIPMTPLLKAGVQGYFYSSFNFGMQQISAASGWNFVAAEEYGRWVLPGGVSFMAEALWRKLLELEADAPAGCRPYHLRAGCRVVDVRISGEHVLVSYRNPQGELRTMRAQQVVMANSKHIAKHVLQGLSAGNPDQWNAMNSIPNAAYLVINILLNARIDRDFYDLFLLEDGVHFPVEAGQIYAQHRVMDVIDGDYARRTDPPRSVLTLYWPLPFHIGHFDLIQPDSYVRYAERLAPKLREILGLLAVPESAVQQVRMTRWGHSMPTAMPGLIGDGTCERASRPIEDKVFFVNQDNWALPAVETCLLEAQTASERIAALRRA